MSIKTYLGCVCFVVGLSMVFCGALVKWDWTIAMMVAGGTVCFVGVVTFLSDFDEQ